MFILDYRTDALTAEDDVLREFMTYFESFNCHEDVSGGAPPVEVELLQDRRVWTVEGDQTSARFGNSVASAGDVNGDGYDDVIVGAPNYTKDQQYEGAAFVYHGSADGLGITPSRILEGNQASAEFGKGVAGAGDVNGDGYDDVIVGASKYDNELTNEGAAYIYLGSSTGLDDTPSRTLEGNQAESLFGFSVGSAGDVNKDGYDDIIIGAPSYDNGEENEGAAFIYHGENTPYGVSATPDQTLDCDQSTSWFGISVGTAGNVNGDDYDDVIVGAHTYTNGQSGEGAAFIYHGGSSGVSATPSRTLESNQANAQYGVSVGTAGDVNGDGYDDVIVGSATYDCVLNDEGLAFLYHGSSTGVSATQAWSAGGAQENAMFGYSVATAGDVNNDGYDDVIVGARKYDNDPLTDVGLVNIYLGSSDGLSKISNWAMAGDQEYAEFGVPVNAAGDVNGDGFSDLIVAARLYDSGQTDEGRAYVYW
jgi:hypothetical protein